MSGEYYKTKESVKEYIEMAKGHSGADLIEKLRKFLPSGSQLLEIGSGPGTDWKILSETYSVMGSDNSIEFLNHLISRFPNGKFIALDAATLSTDTSFDGIYSNKVLHHLTDEDLETSIKRQYQLLNPNGIICHSFWLGSGTEDFKGMFVNYHSVNELQHLFGEHFDTLLMEKYREFEKDDSVLMIGMKK